MVPLTRNLIVSASLILSDLIGFVIPLYVSIFFIFPLGGDTLNTGGQLLLAEWGGVHCLLAFLCVCWF